MKKRLLLLLAALLVASSAARSMAKDNTPAQENSAVPDSAFKPVAIVSIASYERLMTDIGFLGDLMGSPGLDQNLEGMIQLFTQGNGLVGLDKKRPLGITLATDGAQFQPLVLLPVTNLKQLLESLEGILGQAQDAGNGVLELDVFNQKFYVKEKAGYAILTQSPEAFDELPKDPVALLGGLDKTYDLAARLYIQNVPEVFRSLIIDQLKVGVETGLVRQDNENDEAYDKRKNTVESQIDMLTKAINDIDQLTLGLALNAQAKTAFLDVGISAVPGTGAARQLAKLKNTTSNFSGFLLPDATASLNISATLEKDSATQIVSLLQSLRTQVLDRIDTGKELPTDVSKQLAKQLVSQIFDSVQTTVLSGKIDAGAALNVSDKSLTVVAGAYISDPKAFEDSLKRIAKLAESEPNLPAIKFNAVEHAGIRFHTATIPVPQEQGIAKVLGATLDVAIGIGTDSAYLALGTGSLQLVQDLIDKSKAAASTEVPPLQLNVSLAQIFQFAAAMQDTPDMTAAAQLLANSKGKDHVRVVAMPRSNAINIRIEAQEGVLQLLGNALKNSQAEAGGGALPLPGLAP